MAKSKTHSQSAIKVIQGNRNFYIAAIPSEVLTKCCYATSREKDPVKGFQRVLSEKRALEISKYIDSENSTIPTSIILSAKSASSFEYDSSLKKITFTITNRSFLILDGQHRVFGFAKAKKNLRIPVCIYEDLSITDEVKLFIDINTTHRGVSRELILDVQHMAENEPELDEKLRVMFDELSDNKKSPLYGLMSKSKAEKGKISRLTFNQSLKKIILSETLNSLTSEKQLEAISRYITCIRKVLDKENKDFDKIITDITVFKSLTSLIPDVFRLSIQINKNLKESSLIQVLTPIATYNYKSNKNYTNTLGALKNLLNQDITVSNEML